MIRHVLPALFTLFIWWASTVAIMFLYRRPHTFRWSFPLATLAMLFAWCGLWLTRSDTTIAGTYLAFVCGVAICGWHLLSFYTGVATGPRLLSSHATWPRLGQAIYASLYHEIIGVGFAALAIGLTWGAKNQIGMATLLILWLMHQSARLNVLLGVRNFNARMLPSHLDWVQRLISRRTGNLYFPFSILLSGALTVFLVSRALSPLASVAESIGTTFLGLMMALALLEHALLMLPEPRFVRQPRRNPPPAMLPEE